MLDSSRIVNYSIKLNATVAALATFLVVFLFAGYEYGLARRLFSRLDYDKALCVFGKARFISKDLIVNRSLLYQNGLKLLRGSLYSNPVDARTNFQFAEIINEIEEDPDLNKSLDIKNFTVWFSTSQDNFLNIAERGYKEAISREPTDAIYHQRLGYTYVKSGENRKAEDEFERAVLLDPQNISLRLYLSRYFSSKDMSSFYIHINRAMEIDKQIYLTTSWEMQNFLKTIGREDLIKQ